MKTYLVECMETTTFVVEVEAQSEDEARDLVNEDVNNYEVIDEKVSDWEINLIEELDGDDDYSADDVAKCVIDTNGDYAECVDRLVDSMEITEFQEHLEVNKFIRDN